MFYAYIKYIFSFFFFFSSKRPEVSVSLRHLCLVMNPLVIPAILAFSAPISRPSGGGL